MIIFVEHKSRQDGEEGRLLLNSFPQRFENEWSSNQMVERWQGGYHSLGHSNEGALSLAPVNANSDHFSYIE